eukprot:PhF_6_TR25387/c0_g2_i2/m.35105
MKRVNSLPRPPSTRAVPTVRSPPSAAKSHRSNSTSRNVPIPRCFFITLNDSRQNNREELCEAFPRYTCNPSSITALFLLNVSKMTYVPMEMMLCIADQLAPERVGLIAVKPPTTQKDPDFGDRKKRTTQRGSSSYRLNVGNYPILDVEEEVVIDKKESLSVRSLTWGRFKMTISLDGYGIFSTASNIVYQMIPEGRNHFEFVVRRPLDWKSITQGDARYHNETREKSKVANYFAEMECSLGMDFDLVLPILKSLDFQDVISL